MQVLIWILLVRKITQLVPSFRPTIMPEHLELLYLILELGQYAASPHLVAMFHLYSLSNTSLGMNIGTVQRRVLQQQILNKGGRVVESPNDRNITHYLVESSDASSTISQQPFQNTSQFVLLSYVTESLKKGSLVDVQHHRITIQSMQPVADQNRGTNHHPSAKKIKVESLHHSEDGIPKCNHGLPAALRQVKKDGPNTGKMFYCCQQQYPMKRCNYFSWGQPNETVITSPPAPSVVKKETKEGKGWLHYSFSDEEDAEDRLDDVKIEYPHTDDPTNNITCRSPQLSGSEGVQEEMSTKNKRPWQETLQSTYREEEREKKEEREEKGKKEKKEKRKLGWSEMSYDTDDSSQTPPSPPIAPTQADSTTSQIPPPPDRSAKGMWRKGFACQQNPSQIVQKESHPNKHITDILSVLQQKSTSLGDKWREYAYRKAITALKNYPQKVETLEEARAIRGIGEKIAVKIGEIIDTGELGQAKHRDEFSDALEVLSKIWGAGPTTVQRWISQGVRGRPQLLNHQTKIGLKHYEDFQKRIPREEVSAIEAKVQQVLYSIDKTLKGCAILVGLVGLLRKCGLLTDDLAGANDRESNKYMGVCRLEGKETYRRIDIRVYPLHEWPLALLYFTGSDHFNRSMRLWAKKNGFHLSEHEITRRHVKGLESDPIMVTSEEDIFKVLGLEYRAPEDRDYQFKLSKFSSQ
ncbi:hypothetical protein PROFUN_02356 [Planoprotostelium fungivorum]|uniref:Uncharacterized protein n=1 Tax=Planoprotostelium fungivorum TaxID=1890364 RepID=A0A2P6NUP7_9EUKA|nr:hypothetical protein PROFUN_02356 [Planoprotostelium fungivorum]